MYRSTYHKICIAYHVSHITVSHIMYRISCLAHPVSHHPYARPRGATGSHGGPRRGTKKAVEQHGGPRGATAGSQKVRTHATGGHGGPRGATGGHGVPRPPAKKSRNTNRPLQYPRGPLQAAPVWGTILHYIILIPQTGAACRDPRGY